MTEEIRPVDVKGRKINVRRLRDAQLLLLLRDAENMRREDVSLERKLKSGGYIMDIFESAIVEDADKDYVLRLVRQGDLEILDLTGMLSTFAEDEQDAPVPAKVVKRGRPRKTQPAPAA